MLAQGSFIPGTPLDTLTAPKPMVSGDGSCLLSGAAAHLRPCGRGLRPLPLLPPGLSCNLNPHFGCHQHYVSSTPSRAFWMPLLFIRVKNLPTESGGLAAKLFLYASCQLSRPARALPLTQAQAVRISHRPQRWGWDGVYSSTFPQILDCISRFECCVDVSGLLLTPLTPHTKICGFKSLLCDSKRENLPSSLSYDPDLVNRVSQGTSPNCLI